MTGRRRVPLWAWSSVAAAALVATAVVLAGGVLALGGRLGAEGRLAVAACGAVVLPVVAVAAGLLAEQFASAVRVLRGDALLRLEDPSRTRGPTRPAGLLGARGTAELAELGRVLEALHLRVRLGDDVAERHRRTAENAGAGMFELLSGLVAAEEGARGQLAAELHDTVAQSLLAARMLLADGPGGLDRAADCVAEAEEQVRGVMARTRPPQLRDGDLGLAVAALRDDLDRRYGLRVVLDWPPAPRPLPLATAVVVYRFFQEALQNVVKHADTDLAAAALALEVDGLVASVTDSGPGFDLAVVRGEAGRQVGLGLLRERARLAGGTVEVTSSPGTGTRVLLRLPLRAPGVGTFPAPAPPTALIPAQAPPSRPQRYDARGERRDARGQGEQVAEGRQVG